MSLIILGFDDNMANKHHIKEYTMNEMIANIQNRVPSLMEAAIEASGASPYQPEGMLERQFHSGHKGYVYAVVERIKKKDGVRIINASYAREVATCIYEGEDKKELEYETPEEIAHVVVAVTKSEADAMTEAYNRHVGRGGGRSGHATMEALIISAGTLRSEKLSN
jgi:hypothetical protein